MNVGVLEAKNRLSELIEAAQRGEEVTITKRGEPVVTLQPVEGLEAKLAKARAGLAEIACIRERIRARMGREFTYEELRDAIDDGRPE